MEKNLEHIKHVHIVEDILGVKIRTAHGDHLIEVIRRHLNSTSEDRWQLVFAYQNMHGLALTQRYRDFNYYIENADWVILDGAPMIWILKLLGHDLSMSHRATMLDWLPNLFGLLQNANKTVYLLGTTQKKIEKAFNVLSKQFPDLNIIFRNGYFNLDSTESANVIRDINNSDVDVLLVGMGMPRQEAWVTDARDLVNCRVIIPVGGYFDYFSDETYIPPRWVGSLGLEWLARLCSNPRRLWRRYLIEPWPVLIRLIPEILKARLANK